MHEHAQANAEVCVCMHAAGSSSDKAGYLCQCRVPCSCLPCLKSRLAQTAMLHKLPPRPPPRPQSRHAWTTWLQSLIGELRGGTALLEYLDLEVRRPGKVKGVGVVYVHLQAM